MRIRTALLSIVLPAWAAAGLACSSGAGSLEPVDHGACAVGQSLCGDVCANTTSDPNHCGACFNACWTGSSCENGACVCPAGTTLCDGNCADLLTDANHCSACGIVCPAGQSCTGGQCSGGSGCSDACPFAGGIAWGCRRRFMYGMNYAWHHFGGDFGGISEWGQSGVSGNPAIGPEFAEMRSHGVSVIRWWVWPAFRGQGVTFDGSETPTGLGPTTIADLNRALALADQYDLYLMLCLFSFDNFEASHEESGIWVPGIRLIATDASKRAALVNNVVRPFAGAAEASPHKDHLIAWDVINEPEGATHGPSKYGDPAFDPWGNHQTVTHDQMETFIADVIAGLRQESNALVTVGGTAMKWRRAWSQVDIDFYQFHIYDWADQDFPYYRSPADYEVTDKPVVMGEFPTTGLSSANYATLLNSWYGNGYAGALSWQYRDFVGRLGDIQSFANQHPCETQY